MDLGSTIIELRKKREMKQNELAVKAKIASSHLSLIEKNKKDVNIKTLTAIAKALKIPLPILFFLSISKEDIPSSKKDSYNLLSPLINSLVDSIFIKD